VQQQQCRSICTYIIVVRVAVLGVIYAHRAMLRHCLLHSRPPFTDSLPPMTHCVFSSGAREESLWDGTVDTLQQTLGQTGTKQKQMQLVNATTRKENNKTHEPSGRPHSIKALQEN